MASRRYFVLAVAWLTSLFIVGAWARAQPARQWTPIPDPVVYSGGDIGFRVEWMHGTIPTGTVVIRRNGQWFTAEVGGPLNARVRPQPPEIQPR